jgi:hypothetical protein
MGAFSIWHIIILVVFVGFVFLVLWPISKILQRAGFSGWLSLLYFVPFVNLAMLWVFALSPWPALGENSN